jgi:hypothetical protein
MKIRHLAQALIAIMSILILIMVLEFLATTDIYHDYVSKSVVAKYAPESVNAFPLWSDTPSEWKMANFSLVSRIVLIITSLILSINIFRRIKREKLDQ